MSTPVVTDKWAGNFDCDFCRRKRLMGSEFSKKALEKYRKSGGQLKCKECVAKVEEEERKAAAAKRQAKELATNTSADAGQDDQPPRACTACKKSLPFSAYNKNQWNKGEGKARCRTCVEKSLADEAAAQKQSKDDKMEAAQQEVANAKASGNPAAILKAESVLSALEAEKVTGLKPVRMGRGRGRGRGHGGRGGSGRGALRR